MTERQDIALVATKGAYTGKPRPWVVIQSDDYRGTDSVIVCAFTHVLVRNAGLLRIDVTPSVRNGLRLPCQLQVEKVATIRRSDLGKRVGRLRMTPCNGSRPRLRPSWEFANAGAPHP